MHFITLVDPVILGGTAQIEANYHSSFDGWIDLKISAQTEEEEQSIRITPTIEDAKRIAKILEAAIREHELAILQGAADVFIETASV